MKQIKLFEDFSNEIPKIPFKSWKRTGEKASDGLVWVVANHEGRYFITMAYPEYGSISGIEEVEDDYIDEITKEEYESYYVE